MSSENLGLVFEEPTGDPVRRGTNGRATATTAPVGTEIPPHAPDPPTTTSPASSSSSSAPSLKAHSISSSSAAFIAEIESKRKKATLHRLRRAKPPLASAKKLTEKVVIVDGYKFAFSSNGDIYFYRPQKKWI